MQYEIVELASFSGERCTIYSILLKGRLDTLFDSFLRNNWGQYPEEMNDLLSRLQQIGHDDGLREGYYEPNEGKPGDGVCVLKNKAGGRLRLFFIRYGNDVIIIGGGGYKPKELRSWQDDPKLREQGDLIILLAEHIGRRIQNKDDLRWSNDLTHLLGDLKNYDNGKDE